MNRSRLIKASCLLTFTTLLFFLMSPGREPEYQGKRLTEWLEELHTSGSPEEWQKAAQSIRAMGTNTLPALMAKASTTDSVLRRLLFIAFHWQPFFKAPVRAVPDEQTLAILGLCALGPIAEPVLPTLLQLSIPCQLQKPGSTFNRQAWQAIESIGPEPLLRVLTNHALSVDIRAQAIRRLGSIAYAPAVSSLLQCLEHESPKIQTDIVGALRNLATRGAERRLIATGFTKSLRHSASEVRLSIVIGLGELQKDAVEAVPELIKLIAESDGQLQSEARIALKLIDSEPAAKLGIQ